MVGAEALVPTLHGTSVRYVNLDNAASTPPLRSVAEAITDLLPYYASVHRGAGQKSRLCTAAYEAARDRVGSFFGADPDRDVVIFGKNTTEAINKLAHRLPLDADAVVLSTLAEHHSNLLPWRSRAALEHVAVLPDGSIDEDDLDDKLCRYRGRVALVAVNGASNVTGIVPPIERFATKAHAVGAAILVDGAQLAPHRPVDMNSHDDPAHIDYLAISGHKLYAPFGTGALIGPRSTFDQGEPEYGGGGTVVVVTADGVLWDDAPARDEAGSPNIVGAVALGVALTTLAEIGMDTVAANEHVLLTRLLEGLDRIEGVELHGPRDPAADRVGVVPFDVVGVDHRLVAARLAHEYGIGVRSGCFCAQPLVAKLLDIPTPDPGSWVPEPDGARPGLVRASLACYTEASDVDRLLDAVREICANPATFNYRLDAENQFVPNDHAEWLPPELQHLTV
ncbi:MAG: aminotransferase class V-fold PLP-dependent enzyme [Acidimicrobiales bacterium]